MGSVEVDTSVQVALTSMMPAMQLVKHTEATTCGMSGSHVNALNQ